MTENQVWAVLIGIINTGLTARGLTATVQQGYQPTQQGVQTPPTVALHSISNRRVGSPNNKSLAIPDTDNATQTQSYWLERVIQVDALSIQDPKRPSRPTPFDLVDAVAAIMQSESTITTLRASHIGIQRVTDLRAPFIADDRDRNEASPNFDFTITYLQSRSETVPAVVGYENGFYHV